MTNLDLWSINAYGRPLVQPTAATPAAAGQRVLTDPREATLPSTPLAARTGPDLRQSSVGTKQSSGTSDTTNDDERSTVQGRGRGSTSGASSKPRSQDPIEDGGRGNTLDVTV